MGCFKGSATPNTIQEIHIPDSVKYVRQKSFDGGSVKKIKFYGEIDRAENIIINACRKLETVQIPFIKRVKGMQLFENLDGDGNKSQQVSIDLRIEDNTSNTNLGGLCMNKCPACVKMSAFAKYCSSISTNNPTNKVQFKMHTLEVFGSEYTSSNGYLIQGITTLKNLYFLPQCYNINSLPLFSGDGVSDYQLTNIYITNILSLNNSLIDENGEPKAALFPEGFDSSKVTIYVSWRKKDYEESAEILESIAGNAKIVYNYKAQDWDTDFIGVSFNGKNLLREYNVYRTSEGDRYETVINSNIKLNTASEKTFDGTYLFDQVKQPLNLNLNLAFDGLTDIQLKELTFLFSPNQIGPLVFDEYPYKVYDAKVTGQPKMDYVLFDGPNNTRIYKGTMAINMVVYYPFAHTPIDTKYGADGKYLKYYDPIYWSRKEQWKEVSGLIDLNETLRLGENRGEMPAPYIVTLTGSVKVNDYVIIAGNKIIFKENCSNVEWNSKTGLVVGDVGGVRRAVRFAGQSIHRLPITDATTNFANYITYNLTDGATFAIDYQFWYY